MQLLRIGTDGITDESGRVRARWWRGNALETLVPAPVSADDCPVACWSGWGERSDTTREVFEPGLLWSRSTWTTLSELVVDRDVWLIPHARHVLSDPTATASWAREYAGSGRVKFVIDPAGWLTSAMLTTAEDHFVRMFQALRAGTIPGELVAAVVVRGVTPIEPEWGGEAELGPHALAGGAFSPEVLIELATQWAAEAGVPIALREGSWDEDLALVRPGAGAETAAASTAGARGKR